MDVNQAGVARGILDAAMRVDIWLRRFIKQAAGYISSKGGRFIEKEQEEQEEQDCLAEYRQIPEWWWFKTLHAVPCRYVKCRWLWEAIVGECYRNDGVIATKRQPGDEVLSIAKPACQDGPRALELKRLNGDDLGRRRRRAGRLGLCTKSCGASCRRQE
ncbi:hypothetical protein LX32DRAFT_648402 [Colletotrichum zoysiae]|uniref:Uncharacterized protein n=1 Tax=Colletotrichum zoysiae TaxID=1216348 RepID=A0AAD9M746_9PEZI|nr:hypothetical protein LX32DRAFT_648402 [Colletotrichum zoysiae]